MHRFAALVLVAAVSTAACGDDDNPTSPSSLPLVFSAILRPANEVPPVSNAESVGVGAAQITLNLTRDAAGAITGGTADIYFQAGGFPAGMTVVGAHIHPGVAGVNGGVIVGTSVSAAAPLTLSNGSGEFTQRGIPVAAATAQAIAASPAAFYFNIHSPLNSGGFARGQLTQVQ